MSNISRSRNFVRGSLEWVDEAWAMKRLLGAGQLPVKLEAVYEGTGNA